MKKPPELHRQLADAVSEVHGSPEAVNHVLVRAHRAARRRRVAIIGSGFGVLTLAIATPALLHGRAATPNGASGNTSVGISTSPRPSAIVGMQPQPEPTPPPAIAIAQQAAQSVFDTYAQSVGATTVGPDPAEHGSSDQFTVGEQLMMSGRAGNVHITVYKSASSFGTGNPCDSMELNAKWEPTTCTQIPQADGSTTWYYQLNSSLDDGEIVLTAVNIRADGQAVLVQNGNRPYGDQTDRMPVLSKDQTVVLADLPGLTFN